MTIETQGLIAWAPVVFIVITTVVTAFFARWSLDRSKRFDNAQTKFRQQIWTIVIVLTGLIFVIFMLPARANQDVALGVIGLVVTGALAISSQSIIANGMAGLMLHSLGNFKPGDFIEVSGNLGRVSEVGLFHTEIQTPDRDLTTIPNSLMMTQPVKVVRASGTIVSATVSIGYDVSRHQLESLFVLAAEAALLSDPFVQVVELGDYSVVYRVAGFLEDPRRLLAARSNLRGEILDTLSMAEIEIMSPMYVSRRVVSEEPLLPHEIRPSHRSQYRKTAEDKVFDKAELASGIESQRKQLEKAESNLKALKAEQADLAGDDHQTVQKQIVAEERHIAIITGRIETLEALHKSE